MIYIFYLCFVILGIATGKLNDTNTTKSDVDFITNGFYICVLILPIWGGIRDIVNELKKINKHLEKSEDLHDKG